MRHPGEAAVTPGLSRSRLPSEAMEFTWTAAEQAFADEVRTWLEEHLVGANADLRGRGGVGQEDVEPELSLIHI